MKTFKTKEEAQAALNARTRANVQTTVDTRGYAAPVSDADAEFATALQRGDASQAAAAAARAATGTRKARSATCISPPPRSTIGRPGSASG